MVVFQKESCHPWPSNPCFIPTKFPGVPPLVLIPHVVSSFSGVLVVLISSLYSAVLLACSMLHHPVRACLWLVAGVIQDCDGLTDLNLPNGRVPVPVHPIARQFCYCHQPKPSPDAPYLLLLLARLFQCPMLRGWPSLTSTPLSWPRTWGWLVPSLVVSPQTTTIHVSQSHPKCWANSTPPFPYRHPLASASSTTCQNPMLPSGVELSCHAPSD
ncbi:hypothetical protein EDB81DRAFT_475715 [Dactylonectria macrodidyma]|uniref:Uncharacterized protein n=1 Tax=Dactylonectria macrodidyma TaxID=307937 RepID=A0A9P9EZ68_9HYPO|nr:hypothetical protein EDB81DRAFT_475715 [Dactylonectria macrodidyma]